MYNITPKKKQSMLQQLDAKYNALIIFWQNQPVVLAGGHLYIPHAHISTGFPQGSFLITSGDKQPGVPAKPVKQKIQFKFEIREKNYVLNTLVLIIIYSYISQIKPITGKYKLVLRSSFVLKWNVYKCLFFVLTLRYSTTSRLFSYIVCINLFE